MLLFNLQTVRMLGTAGLLITSVTSQPVEGSERQVRRLSPEEHHRHATADVNYVDQFVQGHQDSQDPEVQQNLPKLKDFVHIQRWRLGVGNPRAPPSQAARQVPDSVGEAARRLVVLPHNPFAAHKYTGQDDKCAICRDDLNKNKVVRNGEQCTHVLHEECRREYDRYKNLPAWKCPTCRGPMRDRAQNEDDNPLARAHPEDRAYYEDLLKPGIDVSKLPTGLFRGENGRHYPSSEVPRDSATPRYSAITRPDAPEEWLKRGHAGAESSNGRSNSPSRPRFPLRPPSPSQPPSQPRPPRFPFQPEPFNPYPYHPYHPDPFNPDPFNPYPIHPDPRQPSPDQVPFQPSPHMPPGIIGDFPANQPFPGRLGGGRIIGDPQPRRPNIPQGSLALSTEPSTKPTSSDTDMHDANRPWEHDTGALVEKVNAEKLAMEGAGR